MTFRISFSELDRESGVCKTTLSVGDIQVRSSPQTIADHFRDLEANKYFLKRQVLASLFLGEEPLLNLNYEGNGTINAYRYTDSIHGRETVHGGFSHNEAVSYLKGILDALGVALKVMGLVKEELIEQVARDIDLGVYDVYLRGPD